MYYVSMWTDLIKYVIFVTFSYPTLYLWQGCQIFPGTIYQYGKNIPNDPNIYIPKGHKVYICTKWP
jgi:hypothetical protein